MQKNEYLGSLVLNGQLINFGSDDYSQSYFIEYLNQKGELKEIGLGIYNLDYIEAATAIIDYKGYIISCNGIDEWHEHLKNRYRALKRSGLTDEEANAYVEEEDSSKYEIYNYQELYDKLIEQFK